MKFTMRAMKTYRSAQTLGFFDVELRSIERRSRSRGTAAMGLIMIYPAPSGARYESRFGIGI